MGYEKRLELIKNVKKIYPYYTNINLMKKKDLQILLNNNCKNDIILHNINNSCYIDSLLIALFNTENNDIYNILLNSPVSPIINNNKILLSIVNKIRKELQDIYKLISSNNKSDKKFYCTDLRKLLNVYQKKYIKYINKNKENIDWLSEQSEPFTFINELNSIFEYENSTEINKILWGCNIKSKNIPNKKKLDLISKSNIKNNFVITIDIDKLINNKILYLKKIFPIQVNDVNFEREDDYWKINNKNYSRKIEKLTILSSKFILIHIPRLLPGKKLYNIVIPNLKLKLKKNKFAIYLKSMIIHIGDDMGGHYICLYNCNGIFYKYDDMDKNIKKIGNFQEMCKYKNGFYLKNCTDILYT
tara:strand:- start:2486 stop:3562 length:1077 start_codon:yes stop_codon:yes gene_type:complete